MHAGRQAGRRLPRQQAPRAAQRQRTTKPERLRAAGEVREDVRDEGDNLQEVKDQVLVSKQRSDTRAQKAAGRQEAQAQWALRSTYAQETYVQGHILKKTRLKKKHTHLHDPAHKRAEIRLRPERKVEREPEAAKIHGRKREALGRDEVLEVREGPDEDGEAVVFLGWE